jgi:hypothetical protein
MVLPPARSNHTTDNSSSESLVETASAILKAGSGHNRDRDSHTVLPATNPPLASLSEPTSPGSAIGRGLGQSLKEIVLGRDDSSSGSTTDGPRPLVKHNSAPSPGDASPTTGSVLNVNALVSAMLAPVTAIVSNRSREGEGSSLQGIPKPSRDPKPLADEPKSLEPLRFPPILNVLNVASPTQTVFSTLGLGLNAATSDVLKSLTLPKAEPRSYLPFHHSGAPTEGSPAPSRVENVHGGVHNTTDKILKDLQTGTANSSPTVDFGQAISALFRNPTSPKGLEIQLPHAVPSPTATAAPFEVNLARLIFNGSKNVIPADADSSSPSNLTQGIAIGLVLAGRRPAPSPPPGQGEVPAPTGGHIQKPSVGDFASQFLRSIPISNSNTADGVPTVKSPRNTEVQSGVSNHTSNPNQLTDVGRMFGKNIAEMFAAVALEHASATGTPTTANKRIADVDNASTIGKFTANAMNRMETPPVRTGGAAENPSGSVAGVSAVLSNKTPHSDVPTFKFQGLNRQTSSLEGGVAALPVKALADIGAKAINKEANRAIEAAKSAVGFDAKMQSISIASEIGKAQIGKTFEATGINIQSGKSLVDVKAVSTVNGLKTVTIDTTALASQKQPFTIALGTQVRLPADASTAFGGIKGDIVSTDGVKSTLSPIGMISAVALTGADKFSNQVKAESISIRAESMIVNGVRIGASPLTTVNGSGGSIRIEFAGTGKDSGQNAISTIRADALVAGGKDGGISIGQPIGHLIGLNGKISAIDITSAVKGDVTTGAITTSNGINITSGNLQPPGQSTKADGSAVPGAVKIEVKGDSPSGRPNDGKFDAGLGVRGSLTPQMVASIANAIRLGLPLPEGVTFHNGEISFNYGNEILFFPGLKAALKFAEVVGLVDGEIAEETADADLLNKPTWSVDTRVQYTVQDGETVESIASVQLGDERFGDLIITINRSEILYRLVDNNKVPFVYPGQVLWLPSDPELNIYRKNFFSRKSGGLHPAAPRLSGEVTAGRITGAGQALHDQFIESNAPGKFGRPRTTVREIPQLNAPKNEQLTEAKKQQCIQGALERLNSAIDADVNVRTINTKPTVEKSNTGVLIVHASTDGDSLESGDYYSDEVDSEACDGDSDTVFVAEPSPERERLLNVRSLSREARIIVSDYASNPLQSFVKLELYVDGQWSLVSLYDCTEGATARVRNGKNGVKSTMMLHLPSSVVRTMAMEDYSRNWATYRANFIANKVNNCQIDSVPPTPVDFNRVSISLT